MPELVDYLQKIASLNTYIKRLSVYGKGTGAMAIVLGAYWIPHDVQQSIAYIFVGLISIAMGAIELKFSMDPVNVCKARRNVVSLFIFFNTGAVLILAAAIVSDVLSTNKDFADYYGCITLFLLGFERLFAVIIFSFMLFTYKGMSTTFSGSVRDSRAVELTMPQRTPLTADVSLPSYADVMRDLHLYPLSSERTAVAHAQLFPRTTAHEAHGDFEIII